MLEDGDRCDVEQQLMFIGKCGKFIIAKQNEAVVLPLCVFPIRPLVHLSTRPLILRICPPLRLTCLSILSRVS